ncbi:FAD-binding oxidoreductase [Dactylosporangium sp. CA-139066]|uniref:FAD-binding oxidoreductase n=1 Tax=Dactylosporangium sp. CA-139066 TaxID=3239930 RepID=UPI003D8A6616
MTSLISTPAETEPETIAEEELPQAAPLVADVRAEEEEPGAVFGAVDAADVVAAVRFAGEHGMPVSLRPAAGAVLVTIERMDGVVVDASARRARVEGGARWAHVIAAAAPHGLFPVCADSSAAGVVAHILGRGAGPLGRRYGYAADHVRAIDIVTSNGELRTVDARREPELFWALRSGGGAKLGIVTAVELDLAEGDGFYGGGLYFEAEHAGAVLRAYREWSAGLPESMCTSVAMLRLPDTGELPDSLRGAFVTHVRVAYVGTPDDGAELLAPMRAAAPMLVDDVSWRPYTEIDTVHRDPDEPEPVRARGVRLGELSERTVERVLDAAGPQVNVPLPMVEIRHLAGTTFALHVAGHGAPGLAPLVDAVTERVLDVETTDQGFDGERLARVKRTYDPAGLFG